jgi:hypothetical protein
MDVSLLLSVVLFCESCVVLGFAEPAIARMSPCTAFLPRVAFWLLSIGALWQAVSILSGGAPTGETALIMGGIALLLACERRRHVGQDVGGHESKSGARHTSAGGWRAGSGKAD